MIKRFFDIIFSVIGLMILMPFLFVIVFYLKMESGSPILFVQKRVGKNNLNFNLFKFRTMKVGADKEGLLTLGNKDKRITNSGYFLRKYKLDELPQLLNVFIGDMSIVGPRPEVRKYVNHYTKDQLRVLEVKPGVTDVASIEYRNEVELLKDKNIPEEYYINNIMPKKIKLSLEYISKRNFFSDLLIIIKTFFAILRPDTNK